MCNPLIQEIIVVSIFSYVIREGLCLNVFACAYGKITVNIQARRLLKTEEVAIKIAFDLYNLFND